MKKLTSLFAIFLLLLSVTACNFGNKIDNPLNYEVQNFTFTNQNGEPFGLKDLKGKIWVADFVFTNCETVCPPMTAHMAQLQRKVKEAGLKNVEFVSFSVDPEMDTPEVLKEYAAKYEADEKNWHFLTGYSQEEIENFAKESFKTIVQKPQNTDQVIHGVDFYLVDQNGKVLKSYNGVENTPYEEIIKDIKTLQ
jgi:protein SCO1